MEDRSPGKRETLKLGVPFRLALASSVLLAVVAAVFGCYSVRSFRTAMESREIERLFFATEGIGWLAARMWDNELMLGVAETFLKVGLEKENVPLESYALINPDRIYVMNSDDFLKGKRVEDSEIRGLIERAESGAEPRDLFVLSRESGMLRVLLPVDDPVLGRRGYVTIVSSIAFVEESVASFTKRTAGGVFFLFLFAVGIVYWHSRTIFAPISKLRKIIEALNRRGEVEKVHINSNDEVQELSLSINRMMDNWKSLYEEGERRRGEAEAHSRLNEAVIESIASGVVVVDTDGTITQINRAVETNSRVSRSAAVGKPFWDVFPGWEGEDLRRLMRRVMDEGAVYVNERAHVPAADGGEPLVINVNIQPIRDAALKTAGALVVIDYLSDKVLLEEHLLRVNEELQRANKVKTEFLSMVSHELRTPLTLIKMYTSMMADRKLGALTPKQEKALSVMGRRCENLNDMINDLLDLSRIETGQMEMEFGKTRLAPIISATIEAFEPAIAEKELSLHVEIEDDLPPVFADPDKLSRALGNLIENAVKFTDEKGAVTVTGKRMRTEETPGGDYALVSVSDTGTGIPASEFSKIFQKFYQVDGSDTRKHGGSGLGLSIVREIVELHGGSVWLESEPGKGSTFYLTVPFFREDFQGLSLPSRKKTGPDLAHEPPASAVEKRKTVGKILLIDDDEDFLDMMNEVLSLDGYVVERASDGIEGLGKIFDGDLPDLILLDITMPRISGYDLCRFIRMTEAAKDLPVLMLTAAGHEEQIARGYEVGASGYLVKPFELEDFLETVKSLNARREKDGKRNPEAGTD
ncbi:MAG: ATP-binding protein [bacterium]